MSRVPDYPPKPVRPILTIRDHIDAGLIVTSYCSAVAGHFHALDLRRLAEELGPDSHLDYNFRVAQRCQVCGAPGGGLQFQEASPH
jgi:hypothetical protein